MPSERAQTWIDHLKLQPHPEGGYFAETYRSDEFIPRTALPDRFAGARAYSTGIYFLLTENDVSHFHRIQSDEMWHFYAGDPLRVHMLRPENGYTTFTLGPNLDQEQTFQAVVPAGTIFGADVASGEALVGCTVAPGFDFQDFELIGRKSLLDEHPEHDEIIIRLT